MDTLRREANPRETTRHDTGSGRRPDVEDGDDLLAWLTRDNVSDPFADRRFIL